MRGGITAALLLAATPLAAATVAVPSGRYVIDPAHASVTWRINHLGLSFYTARFTRFTSTVDLDATDVARSKLAVAIEAKSVRTDFPFPDQVDFDAEVGTGEKFLNGTAFPSIKFVSTGITVGEGNNAKIAGRLTMRGVTRPVVLEARLNGTLPAGGRFPAPVFGVSARTVIDRADYGMTVGAGAIGDAVEVLIEAEYKLVK